MVYRRSRRRYRFGRRHRRRLYRRKMFRRRRRYRRRGRKSISRGSTVSFTTDFPIQNCAYIPVATDDDDENSYGNPPEAYPAWSLSILPEAMAMLPGSTVLYKANATDADLDTLFQWNDAKALNSSLSRSTTFVNGYRKYQCDYPNYLNTHVILDYFNLDRLFAIYDRVRINRVTVTLTVPERTEGGPNHHLYVMYNKGRGFEAANSNDTIFYTSPSWALQTDENYVKGVQNEKGLQWLWKQEDLINACSRNGIRNAKSGWHIRELAYNKPVKISWIPRHSRISDSYQHFIDRIDNTSGRIENLANDQANYSNSHRLVSSSVPTDTAKGDTSEYAWFTGPIVRLMDADLGPASAYTPSSSATLFNTYGIRAHLYCSCTFTAFNQVDPLIAN